MNECSLKELEYLLHCIEVREFAFAQTNPNPLGNQLAERIKQSITDSKLQIGKLTENELK